MKKLRIHYFQHVAFEGLGSIEEWALSCGHTLTSTRFFEPYLLPEISDIDWLIIMGGPMSIHDEEEYSWLIDEKRFIRQTVEEGKTVLGICLGSQLISTGLGARVYRNEKKEIGWFNIELTSSEQSHRLLSALGGKLKVFHWHGDTFDLPANAVHFASSEGCRNQAYLYKDNVLALQFHLELTPQSLQQMLENGRDELVSGEYVQAEKEILANSQLIESNRKVLFILLNRLAALQNG